MPKNKAAQSLARKRWLGTTPEQRSAFAAEIGKLGGRPRSTDRCPCGKWTKAYAAKKNHRCENKSLQTP